MRRRKKEQEAKARGDRIIRHLYGALDTPPRKFQEQIGEVLVMVKTPADGPATMMTGGATNLLVKDGVPVEFAVEVTDETQYGAGFRAFELACNELKQTHQAPRVGRHWHDTKPILDDTNIHAVLATPSRHGDAFDTVRDVDGTPICQVVTLRLLTYGESLVAKAVGWDLLLDRAGGVDALIDVKRKGLTPDLEDLFDRPVMLSKLHSQHPPRWITLSEREMFTSVTGLESDAYMADSSNHEITMVGTLVNRFPWVGDFIKVATPRDVARFDDASGDFTLEEE